MLALAFTLALTIVPAVAFAFAFTVDLAKIPFYAYSQNGIFLLSPKFICITCVSHRYGITPLPNI